MARPTKAGLDYFELDCQLDDKVELIEAEYGLKGFAIVVKLYQSIYSGFGYYCEWTPDISILWARRLGVSHSVGSGNLGLAHKTSSLPGFPNNLINNVVAASIKRNIFSEELFNKYGILTSSGIQKRYLNATSRREKVELKKEYLLLSVGKNQKNVVINSISVDRNLVNVDRNTQSRVEESRVKNNNILCKADALTLFEELWQLYPSKKGKGQVSDAAKRRLLKVGKEEMLRAIERYKSELEKDKEWRKPQNGSTFFTSGYVDYLDANFEPGQTKKKQGNNKFIQFKQNEYDFDSLERDLLSN